MRTLSLLVFLALASVASPSQASWQRFGTEPVAAVDFFSAHQGLLSFADPAHAIQRIDDSVLTGVFQAPDAVTGLLIQDSLGAWATVKNNGLFYGTKHWTVWTNTSTRANLTLVGATRSRVFVYSDSQFYFTVDGSQFTLVSGIPKGDSITAMDNLSDTVVFASSASTLYRSTDRGVTWQSVVSGLGSCRSIFADRIRNLAFAGGDTVRHSTDGGATWSILYPPPPFAWYRLPGFVAGSHDCSGTLFIANNGESNDYNNIRSFDQGQTFEDVGGTPPLTRGVLMRGWTFDRGSLFWWWDTTGYLAISRDGLDGQVSDSVYALIAVQADSLVDTLCGSLANAKKYSVDIRIASALCTGVRIDSMSILSASGKMTKAFTARTLYGDSMMVSLSYTPAAVGQDPVMLRLWFHGIEWGLREHLDFPFSATTSTLPPVLAPLSDLDFGTVSVLSPKTLTLPISNTGCSPLRVDSVVSTNPAVFSVSGIPAMPTSIPSGGNLTVSVTFSPQVRGDALESIEIGTNAGHRFISVQGVGNSNASAVANRDAVEQFALYPNPASTIISVRGVGLLDGLLAIYDLLGREVSRTLTDQSTIDVSMLAEGAYMVRLGKYSARLIIARP